MKIKGLYVLLLTGYLTALITNDTFGQGASLNGFSLKVSPGALAYYGDMSTNDLNIFKRIGTGSKFGAGAGMIKQFSPFFGIQAQFLAGSLYTAAPDNTYFAGSLTEYSLSARFDPLKLFKKKSFWLSPYLSVGVASFSFRSVRREMGTNLVLLPNFGYNEDGVTNARKQTAMSMPMAIGVSYKILPYLHLELEHSIRLTNTDLLDCFKGPSTANDLYSMTSIGFRFSIPDRASEKLKNINDTNILPLERINTEQDTLAEVAPLHNIYVDCEMPEIVQAGQTIEVKLRINQGKYSGPAKLFQSYPDGFNEARDVSKSTLFSFNRSIVSIEWKKTPSDLSINYTYRINVGTNLSGNETIIGRFEYQEPDGTKTVYFNKTVFVENQRLANETKNVDLNSTSSRGNIRKSEPLPGIEFRVQCGAFKENDKADVQLAAKHNITEIIQEEFTGGWYKYTVGSFRSYDEAASYRDKFIARTGILSSFIVAYQDGRRLEKITDAFK
jgi:hypothetical protein